MMSLIWFLPTSRVDMKPYQEHSDSTFESNGKVYSLNVLFKRTHSRSVSVMKMNELDWILEYTHVDSERLEIADISIPMLVYLDPELGKWVLVDGAHRLTKLRQLGKKEVRVKILTSQDMQAAFLHEVSSKKKTPLYAKW